MSEAVENGDAAQLLEVPAVPQKFFGLLGNLPDMDMRNITTSFWRLADLYGPIYSVKLGTETTIVVSSYEFLKDVMDDSLFQKAVGGGLVVNWAKAHRILMPVFGPIAIRKMFDQQLDICSQMILKWDRMGPDHRILAADDFTRLAFDTIAFCAFSYRMNDFYSESMHPFAEQMAYTLIEAGRKSARPAIVDRLHYFENQKYWRDINEMHSLCDQIIEDRVKNPQPDNIDLLNTMLNQEDPDTHEKLSMENIRYQMGTFLVAGHETTSGTLSFLFLNLLRHPDKYIKLQQEVDEVLGNDAITLKHVSKLIYLDACIKETLRYMGPISVLRREPVRDGLLLGGKYRIPKGATISVSLRGLHHDPAAWGEDCDEFKPERFIPFNVKQGSYHPFGIGVRSCIGRSFAEQEMIIAVALIMQRFQVELADPDYKLAIKATLTIKPDQLYLKVRRRPGKSDMVGLQGGNETSTQFKHSGPQQSNGDASKPGLTVLYGSNAGTCKSYAEELKATMSHFNVNLLTMDSGTENLPKDQPVVIITPSYEGKPADNAKKFVSWLESAVSGGSSDLVKGVRYAVFGVGNSEWAATFHKVPKLVDASMAQLGAEKIMEAGLVDVKIDPAGPWEEFLDALMAKLDEGGKPSSSEERITAKITAPESSEALMGTAVLDGVVVKNIDLADDSVGPPKKHIEIELPEGVSYRSGDYLAILPFNHPDTVVRVIRRFKLKADSQVSIEGTNKKHLKTATPTSVFDLISSRVELNTPITRKQLTKLAAAAKDAKEKAAIEHLAENEEAYKTEILGKRASVLDILEDNLSCELPFADYLDMLQALAFRQYSISSSPLSPKNFGAEKVTASLTYDLHTGSEKANTEREFHGAASSYLARLKPGSHINCAVKSTNVSFHLPKDNTVPIIMVAAGSGLAPMRGFIQERAAIANAQGLTPGKALFYFGCRDHEKDYIYKQELQHWQEIGAVQMRPAFSQRGPSETDKSWKYAHERIWDERDELAELFVQGAKIFLCGSASKLAKSTSDTLKKIYQEKTNCSEEEASAWLDDVKEARYVTDVFG